MTNIEQAIKDIALKNRQSVKEDDPILALITIMNRIAHDWQDLLNAALEKHKDEYETAAHRWRKDATKRSEAILNVALNASREAMAKGMNEGSEKVLELVRQETWDTLRVALGEQREGMERAVDEFKKYVQYLMVGSGIVVLLLAVLVAVN